MTHKATLKTMQHNKRRQAIETVPPNSLNTVPLRPSLRQSFTQQVSSIPNDYLFHQPKPTPQQRKPLYSPFLDMTNP